MAIERVKVDECWRATFTQLSLSTARDSPKILQVASRPCAITAKPHFLAETGPYAPLFSRNTVSLWPYTPLFAPTSSDLRAHRGNPHKVGARVGVSTRGSNHTLPPARSGPKIAKVCPLTPVGLRAAGPPARGAHYKHCPSSIIVPVKHKLSSRAEFLHRLQVYTHCAYHHQTPHYRAPWAHPPRRPQVPRLHPPGGCGPPQSQAIEAASLGVGTL